MTKEDLLKLKEKINQLSDLEKKERRLYLRGLANGDIQGPPVGYPSIDEPWLQFYDQRINDDLDETKNIYYTMYEQNINNLDKIAINYYGKLITYGDMFKIIDELTQKFYDLGVRADDIVSICMPTTPETAMCFYALNRLGAVCDMIDPRSNSKQMDYYLKENKSRFLIVCENYIKELYDAMDDNLKNGDLEKVISLPITPRAPFMLKLLVDYKVKKKNKNVKEFEGMINWKQFLDIEYTNKFKEKLNKNGDALIVHSSGTTSTPKGIVLSNKNVNAIAFQYKRTPLDIKSGAKFLSVIPAFASFGLVASINLPFYLQMENIMMPMVDSDIFIKSFKKNDINLTLTVPSNIVALAKSKEKINLSNFTGPGAGGYSIDSTTEKEVNEKLKEKGCPSPMLMGWGMSELASTACLEFPECSKLLSSGVPLPLNKIAIFKPHTDEEVSYMQEGEICVNGPTIMQGYLNNSEKTDKTILKHADGSIWLHSGDIGYMDFQGRVYPVDREDRMIIKGIDGFKMFPQKIEDAIITSEYVDTAVVVGSNLKDKGIVAKAYIVLKQEYLDKNNEAIEDIKQKCKNILSERQVPDLFEFIDQIPYTPMGKIDYKSLENKENIVENLQEEKVKIKSLFKRK